MARYRIEQYGENFYPQHTLGYFWWCYYYKWVSIETREIVKFGTFSEASDFIKNNKRKVYKV